MTEKKLIILDRDGVINYDSDQYIKSVDEWRPIEGSLDAIRRLKLAGYKVAIATNQSGISRQYYSNEVLAEMHNKLSQLLLSHATFVDGIFYCPHLPDDKCHCRKPATGLYQRIETFFQIGLKDVPVVGDSLRDLQAAEQCNAKPILVKTGKGQRTLDALSSNPYPVFNDLHQAVDAIIRKAL